MKITTQLLPYHDLLENRDMRNVALVVLHCTELPEIKDAREFGEKIMHEDGTGNSGHYYVDRDGEIYQYVEDEKIARHVVGYNRESIGIELVNSGRYPRWLHSNHQNPVERYPHAQIESLKGLLRYLKHKYPQLRRIAPHSELDTRTVPSEDDPALEVRRRIDPGPLFPWDEIEKWWEALK
jgi:N-acetylmuramoyl-L-alanine amidase